MYDRKKIARQLLDTAQGISYHGNALRVAKDLQEIDANDRSVLDACMTRSIDFELRMRLQDIGLRIGKQTKKETTMKAERNDGTGMSTSDRARTLWRGTYTNAGRKMTMENPIQTTITAVYQATGDHFADLAQKADRIKSDRAAIARLTDIETRGLRAIRTIDEFRHLCLMLGLIE